MPFINLIQEQRLSVKRSERKARSYFFGFVGIGVLSVGAYLALLLQTDLLKGDESRLEGQIQRAQPYIAQIEDNEKQYDLMSPRVKTLEDAQLITARWDRILTHLSKQTPDHTWVTAVRCVAGDPEKPIAVSFVGMASAQEPIGEFILRLQNSADLEDVQLKYTQEKTVNQAKGVEFEIGANIAGSAKKDAVKKEEQS